MTLTSIMFGARTKHSLASGKILVREKGSLILFKSKNMRASCPSFYSNLYKATAEPTVNVINTKEKSLLFFKNRHTR